MNDEGNDTDHLINDAIDESIKFEELMDKTDFDSWLDGVFLFCWDEIPGNDDEILKKILKENFEIKWAESAEIEKSRDGKTISVSTGKNSLSLRLNDDKTKVELELDKGRVYEFTVETKGDKLNICFTDSSKTLEYLGQSDGPFKNYEKNKTELKYICDQMKQKVDDKSHKAGDKSSLERDLIYALFEAKIKRLDARISSEKDEEKREYKEALFHLLSALNALQNQEEEDNNKRWWILLYNDLSICYAGLGKSSMSRGYAEEARWTIEKEERYLFDWDKILGDDNVRLITFLKENYEIKWVKTAKIEKIDDDKTINVSTNENSLSLKLNDEKTKVNLLINDRGVNEFTVKTKNGKLNVYEESYKDFNKKLSADNSTNMKDIQDHDFVSSKRFELFTIALFNQAEAERRSYRYAEAEKNFKKIIKYGNENTSLINFNYYSAILYLSLLYIDQGRGNEAIKLLSKVITELNEDDIRYWKAFIANTQALIDQSEYEEAEKLLLNKFLEEKKDNYVLNQKHKVTSQGFKGLNYFTSCQIEKIRNTLKITHLDKGKELKKVEKLMKKNIKNFKKRKQKGFETTAYKHLSEIYTLKKDANAMEYFIKYLSNGDIDKLNDFVPNPKMKDWIDDCNDLDFLECFIKEIREFLKQNGKYLNETDTRKILKILEEKFKRECEDKGQLSRAEKIVKIINEVVGEGERIIYRENTFDKIVCNEEKSLTLEDIRNRLDKNEKEFDSVLFTRSKIKNDNNIVELIVLRRWNSFSPGLFTDSTGSLGGGYLLRIKKNSLKNSLFKWDKIPGMDNERLIKFLTERFEIEWVRTAKIEKNEDGKTIRVSTKEKSLSLRLNDEKTKVNLEIDDCIVNEFTVKTENGELKIYEKKKDVSDDCDVENIVIDPGYNFIQNFRSEGFSIQDIDTIIVTHSHLDHCAELLPIMDLIFQINKRYNKYYKEKIRPKKRVNLCLSMGAYKKFSSYTDDPDWQKQLKDVIILENLDDEKWMPFEGLTISAIPTPHMDLGGVKAIGLMIEIDGIEGEKGFEKMYLFCWDDVPEKDSERLKLEDFLVQSLQRRQKDGNWVKNAEIKIDDKKTIKVIDKKNKENLIILELKEEENNVTLREIRGKETYELGFTLRVKKENGKLNIYKKIYLGFTGDTPWYSKIKKDFGGCDLLCVHLGSIKYQEIGYTDDRYYPKGEKREIPNGEKKEKFEETYTKSNHLLFFGTEDIISHYDKTKEDSLIIVGEFGEELKYGLRVDLCKKLSMGKSIQCLPGDIGQYIVIEKGGTKKVRCNFCEEFVGQKEIRTCSYGREDAIHYICQTCNNTLSKLQKQAIIEHRVTRH